MNIIFLDIDGVLNSFEKLSDPLLPKHEWNPEAMERYGISLDVWPIYVERLNRIIAKCDNCKIVMSTSWRLGDEAWWMALKESLYEMGVGAEIIGKTCDPFQTMDANGDFPGKWSKRHEEIQKWLDEHAGVKGFVILDDDWDAEIPGHFVKTSHMHGMQDEHVEEAIKILGGKDDD